MNRRFLLIITVLLHLVTLQAQDRPKVAVVLAGGGAKGVAHISALKTIEEAGIPIDMVVGTSMGSIIGGLYCVGYSPDSMRTICGSNDWVQLIMDNPDYGDNSLTAKKENENYLLRMSIDQERRTSDTGRGGVIAGRNVMRFFQKLTHHLPDSLDFNDLPIPFACVATDAISGKMKVFHHGNLPRCMRASMAIPTVFTPIKIGRQVYIDGGVVDNFPVDVARQMGADIVIGVDLVTQDSPADMANSAVDILLHCIDLVSMDRYKANISSCDIYMPVDVTGYTAASFTAQAIDTLMNRGTYYSQLKAASLDSLHNSLQLDSPVARVRIGEYSFANVVSHRHQHHDFDNPLATFRRNYKNGAVNLGARFDNQEYASILFGLRIGLDPKHNTNLDINGRLGQRIGFTADLTTRTFGTQRMGYRYSLMHRDLNYYFHGEKAAQVTSNQHDLQVYFKQVWYETQYRFGAKYQMHHYNDALYNPRLEFKPDLGWERYWSYFIESEYNSLDQQYFPTSGHQVTMSADFISDNLYEYEGHSLFPILSISYQAVFSPSDQFTFIPHFQARAICSGDASRPWALANVIGGFNNGMQVPHQLTMAGIPYMELVTQDGVGILGITARHQLFRTHYLIAKADIATMANKPRQVFDTESLTWGVQAGYHIKTPVGPVSVDFHWNEHTDKFHITFNAGYYF